jgi:hypothetical protein
MEVRSILIKSGSDRWGEERRGETRSEEQVGIQMGEDM